MTMLAPSALRSFLCTNSGFFFSSFAFIASFCLLLASGAPQYTCSYYKHLSCCGNRHLIANNYLVWLKCNAQAASCQENLAIYEQWVIVSTDRREIANENNTRSAFLSRMPKVDATKKWEWKKCASNTTLSDEMHSTVLIMQYSRLHIKMCIISFSIRVAIANTYSNLFNISGYCYCCWYCLICVPPSRLNVHIIWQLYAHSLFSTNLSHVFSFGSVQPFSPLSFTSISFLYYYLIFAEVKDFRQTIRSFLNMKSASFQKASGIFCCGSPNAHLLILLNKDATISDYMSIYVTFCLQINPVFNLCSECECAACEHDEKTGGQLKINNSKLK